MDSDNLNVLFDDKYKFVSELKNDLIFIKEKNSENKFLFDTQTKKIVCIFNFRNE